jgi:hypothetical protein
MTDDASHGDDLVLPSFPGGGLTVDELHSGVLGFSLAGIIIATGLAAWWAVAAGIVGGAAAPRIERRLRDSPSLNTVLKEPWYFLAGGWAGVVCGSVVRIALVVTGAG